jgi:SAM-dependent methyltransferase
MSKLYEAGHLGGCVKGGDPDTYYPKLWEWLVKRYRPSDVLDVGCGEGQSLPEFFRLGCRVIGIEGLPNITKCGLPVINHDLINGPIKIENIDLVWCCEVVEHIKEKYINNLMQTLANGKIIAMTHALPGQNGYHHVNCKSREYWIYQFKRYGYRLLEDDTKESKNYGHKFWIWSGMIFERI